MSRRFKRVTIPASIQAGKANGIFPIDLSTDAQLQAAVFPTGRNVYVTEDDGETPVPACLIPKGHICGSNGGWTWFTQPVAVYDPVGNNTLTGWVNQQGARHISINNHDTKTQQDILLSTTDLEGDDHNNPSICIRSDGRYLVAYCEHNERNTVKFRVSTNPNDGSAWDAEYSITPTVEGILSYTQLWRLSGEDKIYLFGRHDGADAWYYVTSTDDGATWSAQVDFIDHGTFQCYPRFWTNGVDKFLIVCTKKENNVNSFIANDSAGVALDLTGNRPIYALQYNSGSGWAEMNGDALTLPIVHTDYGASSIIATDVGDDSRWVGDITQDAEGVVHALYYVYPNHDERNHDLYHATYDADTETWSSVKVMDEGGPLVSHYSPSVSYPGVAVFDPLDASKIAVAREVAGIREIEIWQRTGSTWAKLQEITSGSLAHNFRPNFAFGRVAGVEPYLFWMGAGRYEGYEDFTLAMLQHPARPAAGLLVRLELDGTTDRVIRVYYTDKNEDKLQSPQEVAAGMGALNLYIGSLRLADNRANRVNFAAGGSKALTVLNTQEDTEATFGGIKFGPVGSDVSSKMLISPAVENSFRVAMLAIVNWKPHTSAPLQQSILSNNSAGQGGIISRITTATGLFQFYAILSSGAVSLTSDIAVPQNEPVLLYGEYDRFDTAQRLKNRVGETQKVLASVSASMSTAVAPYHTIGQEKPSGTTYPLAGTLSLIGIFERTLPKAYTDTLSRAFTSPATFATIGTEQLDNEPLIADIVAAMKADEVIAKAFTDAETAADIAAADQVLETDGGVLKLKTYRRGTTTEIIPEKTALTPSGADLTNPATEQLGGYKEE
ncbi:BNR-4 repeat-containing protein [Aureliella helgolandensis]|uniref:Sialidase domain-containing protein n=1 Tax=Aureliella helgolandensis TaxID=2527968 RepID=A0A518G751_9BACT|nr:BNR-4 repeat-containing protein [Aureliella helgolandensis]QDV24401.1 hypothetical protein Q31a_27180 [Aureliella helgolandensis]